MDKNEKNEKSEKRRFSMHPNPQSTSKEKRRMSMNPKGETTENLHKRRGSKMVKPQTQENENQQQNIMVQGAVPIYQNQYYPVQPQLMPNGIPIMVNAVPGQALPSNAYFVDQFGNPISYGNVQYAYNPNDINPSICPYCGQKYVAKIEESFNCCTCFIYFIIIILIPILIILAAYSGCQNVHCNDGCDCNCTCCVCGGCACNCCIDMDYYCNHCGKKISSKNTCLELCPCFKCCAF